MTSKELQRLDPKQLILFIAEKGEANIYQVAKHFNVNPNTARYHLQKLNDKHILVARRQKRGTSYKINPKYIDYKKELALATTVTTTTVVSTLSILNQIAIPTTPLLLATALLGLLASWMLFYRTYRARLQDLLTLLARD